MHSHRTNNEGHSEIIAGIMLVVILTWLGFSTLKIDYRAIEAIKGYLPTWFPILNLFLAPILAALAASSLQIRPTLRLVFLVLLFFCLSALYLSLWGHQLTTIIVQVLLFLEAFWLIPMWNCWSERRASGTATPELPVSLRRGGRPSPQEAKSRLRDLLWYIAIGIGLALVIVLYVLGKKTA